MAEAENDGFQDNFQRLLDEQWDALEARSGRVRKVRRLIAAELQELEQIRHREARDLRAYIDHGQKVNKKREEINGLIKDERFGITSQQLKATSQQIYELDHLIQELQNKRAILQTHQRDLESVIASRRSHFNELRNSLPDEIDEGSLKSASVRCGQVESEGSAAQGGCALWQQTCNDLNDLDSDLKRTEELDQIPFMLARGIAQLESHLEQAEGKQWTVLTIAIGHELQVLRDAMSAVQQHA